MIDRRFVNRRDPARRNGDNWPRRQAESVLALVLVLRWMFVKTRLMTTWTAAPGTARRRGVCF